MPADPGLAEAAVCASSTMIAKATFGFWSRLSKVAALSRLLSIRIGSKSRRETNCDTRSPAVPDSPCRINRQLPCPSEDDTGEGVPSVDVALDVWRTEDVRATFRGAIDALAAVGGATIAAGAGAPFDPGPAGIRRCTEVRRISR